MDRERFTAFSVQATSCENALLMFYNELFYTNNWIAAMLVTVIHFAEWFAISRKHLALDPQKPLRLIRDGEAGGSGIFISNTCSLHCHHENDSALRWAAV